jgi:TolB-like protein/Tfp pilus assembly protein PilF
MTIWSVEIKEIEKLLESFKGKIPELEKELGQLIKSEDPNVLMLYSRRCLEVIITDLCECELKRPRKTEPLKGIIDKLYKEEKVPSHILTSMHGLNELSTYGAHPKDFDPEQVKPVLNNLDIIIKWYLKYKEAGTGIKAKPTEEIRQEIKSTVDVKKSFQISKNRIIGSVSGLILLIVIVVAVLFFIKEPEKSIAVLPFRNDSPDSTNEYFIDGTREAILDNLCKIADLTVISRTSVEQFRNTIKPIREIAKQLNVNYILEGSGQRYGNDIRLTVQLIDAVNDKHIWSSPYEGVAVNILKLQSEISEAIASELKAIITPQEKQLIQKIPTNNLEAWEAYNQGILYWRKFTPPDEEVALHYFEQAIEKDPEYALAYAGISSVWVRRGVIGAVSPEEATSKAMAAITKALELDSTRAEVYRSLAIIQMVQRWDWKDAESSFKKAIALNPNYAEAHILYGHLLIIVGRIKEAMEQDELALKLDPLNISFKAHHGFALLLSRRYDDVITIYQEVLKTDPANMYVLGNLPEAFHMVGKYKEEFEAWKSYFTTSFKDFVHVFDLVNTKADYASILNLEADTLVAQSKTKLILPTEIAFVYACAGNKDRAMDMLDRAYEVHDPNLNCLLHPGYDSLRSEPRFQDLCRKMNLPYK